MLTDKEREEKIRPVTTAIEQRSGIDLNIWREAIDRIEKTRRNKEGSAAKVI